MRSDLRVQNYGVVGQVMAASFALAQARMAGLAYASLFPWSQNDGHSAVVIHADYDTYVPAFVTLAHVNGVVPILLTAIPSVALSGADETARLDVNNQVRALAAADVLVVDMDAVMSDGASPARIKAAFSDDGMHENAAGAAAMALSFKTTLQGALH